MRQRHICTRQRGVCSATGCHRANYRASRVDRDEHGDYYTWLAYQEPRRLSVAELTGQTKPLARATAAQRLFKGAFLPAPRENPSATARRAQRDHHDGGRRRHRIAAVGDDGERPPAAVQLPAARRSCGPPGPGILLRAHARPGPKPRRLLLREHRADDGRHAAAALPGHSTRTHPQAGRQRRAAPPYVPASLQTPPRAHEATPSTGSSAAPSEWAKRRTEVEGFLTTPTRCHRWSNGSPEHRPPRRGRRRPRRLDPTGPRQGDPEGRRQVRTTSRPS